MEVTSRRRWSHAVIHIFMLLSGLEYAIIFPTLWEYLLSLGVDSSQTFWLGLTISAMTVTDIISGLIVGRIVDRKKSVRVTVLVLNLFQIAGSLVYLVACFPWLLLVSRLVSGCGKSAAVAFLAEICRSTKKEERTPVLLLFNIAFQIGLLLGPSMNLFLQSAAFHIGPLHVDKLNSPGLLMLGLWTLFSVLIALAYTNLDQLSREEVLNSHLDQGYMTSDTLENIDVATSESDDQLEGSDNISDTSDIQDEEEVVLPEVCYTPVDADETKEISQFRDKVDEIRYDVKYVQGSSPFRDRHTHSPHHSPVAARKVNLPSVIGLQRDLASRASGGTSYGSLDTLDSGTASRWEYKGNPVNLMRRDQRKSDVFIKEAERLMMGDSMTSYYTTSDNHSRLTPSIPETPEPPSWAVYKNALFRPEILVLIFTRLIAFFCQTSLEAIVPPIMNTYFGYDDMANSYLYLAAGLQLLVMFGVLSALARCVSDRKLVLVGMFVMVLALSWHVATFPFFKIGERSSVPFFGVGVLLILLGIPTVADIGLAMYSKLLPEDVQGFGHGLRRFLTQLAVMVGPLWGAGTLPLSPLLLTIPPLLLQVLATVLYCWSYKKMDTSSREEQDGEEENERTPLIT